MRFNREEASGSLGDLGTFVPLLAGMVNQCGMQLGPALFCAGAMNVVSGLLFRIPMPVQPMKVIAAVAIAEGLNEAQILAAGISASAVLLLAAVTGLIPWLNRTAPKSVIRGLQLALGLKLLIEGLRMIGKSGAWFEADGIGMGVLAALVVVGLSLTRRFPAALAVFALGFIALIFKSPAFLEQLRFGMEWKLPVLADIHDWEIGFWRAGLPQVPLTVANSVIAVCALSGDLFPERPVGTRRVAFSVALMNLVCCPLGGMPMCHGAGGLAAQYRFGARTGGSVVILGAAKIALALLFGSSLLLGLQQYPQSVLGVLLAFGAWELARVCRDQTSRMNLSVMILTAAACLATDMAVGFFLGWAIGLLARRVFSKSP
ncbi:MAG: putative sulfate/molybdate transporter [Pirellulales bacterium]|nr:putative sulfate/molybdate transporter [Pirellulales bacterium]